MYMYIEIYYIYHLKVYMKQFYNAEKKFYASSRLLFAKFNGPTIVSKPEIKKKNHQLSFLLYYIL